MSLFVFSHQVVTGLCAEGTAGLPVFGTKPSLMEYSEDLAEPMKSRHYW
jgi:hypothetical protein